MKQSRDLHLILTKVYLFRKIYIEDMLVQDMASEIGCERRSIMRYLKIHGLKSKRRLPDNNGRVFSKERNEKIRISQMGPGNSRYKNGTADNGNGYEIRLKPDGGYILSHRDIMEKHIGRKLKVYGFNHKDNEIVHHKDGNRMNNDIDNLQVMTSSEHTIYHNNERRILKNGGVL